MTKKNFDDLFRRGTRLLHKGKASKAIPLLEQAYVLQPAHVDVAVNLSGAYILHGKFKKARPVLEALVGVVPDNAMVWTNLGAAYLGNPILANDEEQQQAIKAFKRALEINPVAPSVAYNIGLIYRDRQEFEESIFWFRKAIQANPRDRDAHNILRRLEEKMSAKNRGETND